MGRPWQVFRVNHPTQSSLTRHFFAGNQRSYGWKLSCRKSLHYVWISHIIESGYQDSNCYCNNDARVIWSEAERPILERNRLSTRRQGYRCSQDSRCDKEIGPGYQFELITETIEMRSNVRLIISAAWNDLQGFQGILSDGRNIYK